MKRLYLLRHAQALPAYGTTDFERNLSDEGKSEARALGQVMMSKGYQPDLIYCSPALRTRQTLAGLLETLEERETQSPRSIYESGHEALLDQIQKTPVDINGVLLVAHNPSIHQLAAMLAKESSPKYESLIMGYAPGTLTVLDCELEDWTKIQPGQSQLVDLLAASDYNQ